MTEKNHRIKGIVGTLIIHAVLILLLVIFGFSTPLPLPEEEGVEVNLGNDIEGFGDIQLPKPSAKPVPPVNKQANDKQDIVTQDLEEAPFIEDNKGEKEDKETIVNNKPVEEPVEESPKVNPNALYKGKSQTGDEDASQGDGKDAGDKGNLTGTPEGDHYQGNNGPGSGLSYSLKGRNPRYLPKPSDKFDENGTVVVQITVNRYGKVIKAVAIAKGSNTTNSTLRSLAEQAALNAQFDAKPDAPEVQRGTITYHFVVRN